MSRVEHLATNDIISKLTDMKRQIDALPAVQRINAKNVIGYATQSVVKTYSLASFGSAGTFVTFLSDNQEYPIAALGFQVYNGSLSNPVLPGQTGAPGINIHDQRAVKGQSKWAVNISNNSTTSQTYLIQFCVQATDTGSIALV